MKYLSLFSGIGGFELGINQAYDYLSNTKREEQGGTAQNSSDSKQSLLGSEQPSCIGFSEIDKYAIQVYRTHFNHKNYGDITKIKPEDLPDFELLVGGFPCQSFSIAGKRRGFDDTRGTLFFEIARIVREKQPRLLLLENVKGLLSNDKGRTFATIITTLDELGYDCQWQVLNSKNFGVPQNRERVFIVGHLRGTSRPEVFPICKNERISFKTEETEETRTQTKFSTTVRVGMGNKADSTFIQSRPHGFNKGGKKEIPNMRFSSIQNELVDGIRRLTPKECERLQGFPDDWTSEGTEGRISDTQRYKMCGNAVTVNVIKEIMLKIWK